MTYVRKFKFKYGIVKPVHRTELRAIQRVQLRRFRKRENSIYMQAKINDHARPSDSFSYSVCTPIKAILPWQGEYRAYKGINHKVTVGVSLNSQLFDFYERHIDGGLKLAHLCTPYNFIKCRPIYKLFQWQNQEIVAKNSTTPQMCRYTTLWNVNILNKHFKNKTSVTTYFKKLTTENNEFIVSFIV